MTREERIEYLTKAVMTLSELGDNKTAFVLNEIRLELKRQPSLPSDVDEAARKYAEKHKIPVGSWDGEPIYNDGSLFCAYREGAMNERAKMLEEAVEGEAHPDDCEIWVNLVGYGYDIKDGDKVKIIVVKED